MRSSLFGKLRPQLPDDMHPGLVDLIHRCWHQDPDHRPSSAEVVVEIKRLVDSFGCIDPNIATVFGLDEGYISTLNFYSRRRFELFPKPIGSHVVVNMFSELTSFYNDLV